MQDSLKNIYKICLKKSFLFDVKTMSFFTLKNANQSEKKKNKTGIPKL